jgi:phenylacetate-CoA ligase
MSVGGELADLADVLTSSGHGGRFSFGVSHRSQASASAHWLDDAFDAAFRIKSKKTLAINCLPMGVVFSSHCMTVATTSVRDDMAVALVQTFGDFYEQILLVGDPLFLKRLTDYASGISVDWGRYRLNVVLGEEIFGEHFRGYLAHCLGLDVDEPADHYIISSFGVAELGLHLCYETPATVALRRRAAANHAFAGELFGRGPDHGLPLPMVFTFDPLRTFIEVVDPDTEGYGQMTISMLDPEQSVPLLRYQTGDIVRFLDQGTVAELVARHQVALPRLPAALIALRGRDKEALPNGAHVGFYKDALYADYRVARHLTGAFRMIFSGAHCTMHVQLTAASAESHSSLEQGILRAMPYNVRPARLTLWKYAEFPFGMGLNYERKFSNYVPGELDAEIRES